MLLWACNPSLQRHWGNFQIFVFSNYSLKTCKIQLQEYQFENKYHFFPVLIFFVLHLHLIIHFHVLVMTSSQWNRTTHISWGPTSSNLLPRLFYHIPLLKPHNFYPITSLLLLISFTAFCTLWFTLLHSPLVIDFPYTHLQNSAYSNKLRFSSAQNSTTETDNSNIFSSFINTGFPLLLEHQVRACTTHTHTQSPHTHTVWWTTWHSAHAL